MSGQHWQHCLSPAAGRTSARMRALQGASSFERSRDLEKRQQLPAPRRRPCRAVGPLRVLLVLLTLVAPAAEAGSLARFKTDGGDGPAAAAVFCDGTQVEHPPNSLPAAAPGNAKREPGQPVGSSLVSICSKNFEGWKGTPRHRSRTPHGLCLTTLGRRADRVSQLRLREARRRQLFVRGRRR